MVAPLHRTRAGSFGRKVAAVLGTACVLGIVAGAVGAGSASGSFPGRNGLIAFVSNRGGGDAIYTMHTTGSGSREVTPKGLQAENPSWSAEGRKIAFDCDDDVTGSVCAMTSSVTFRDAGPGQPRILRACLVGSTESPSTTSEAG